MGRGVHSKALFLFIFSVIPLLCCEGGGLGSGCRGSREAPAGAGPCRCRPLQASVRAAPLMQFVSGGWTRRGPRGGGDRCLGRRAAAPRLVPRSMRGGTAGHCTALSGASFTGESPALRVPRGARPPEARAVTFRHLADRTGESLAEPRGEDLSCLLFLTGLSSLPHTGARIHTHTHSSPCSSVCVGRAGRGGATCRATAIASSQPASSPDPCNL